MVKSARASAATAPAASSGHEHGRAGRQAQCPVEVHQPLQMRAVQLVQPSFAASIAAAAVDLHLHGCRRPAHVEDADGVGALRGAEAALRVVASAATGQG